MKSTVPTEREAQILDRVVEILRRRLSPRKIILFGSRAKGRGGPGADFDLAVDAEKPEGRTRREMAEEIDGAAGLYGVDLVYLADLEEDFRKIVLKTGRVLL